MDDSGTLVTYRYIRIAMVALVVGIGAALLIQRLKVNGFQSSISSYYYTSARGMFVAALFGIGVCLICVRAGSVIEDALLNVAGLLGFVVALVPTPPGGDCDMAAPGSAEKVACDARADAIHNNFPALFWVGVFAMLVLLVVVIVSRESRHAKTPAGLAALISAPIAGAVLFAGYIWYRVGQHSFSRHAHLTAAIAMFAMIGGVALCDGLRTKNQPTTRTRGWLYVAIGGLMGIGGLGIYVANQIHPWNQAMLDAEALLITLFAIFWAAQTIDLWHYTSRREAIAARRAPEH